MAFCAIEGCGITSRKLGWCDRHYQAWRRNGDPKATKWVWGPKETACISCGKTEIGPGMRRFCSVACRQDEYRQRAAEVRAKTLPTEACVACGTPLLTGRVNGRAVHSRTRKFCTDCRSKPRRSYRLAVHILAHYQGTDCGICGEPVDMSVRFPDKRCASIDHIVPLAHGGMDDVTNLRLAHYDCNSRREDYWALFMKVADRDG